MKHYLAAQSTTDFENYMSTEKVVSKPNARFPAVHSKMIIWLLFFVSASFAHGNDQLLLTSLYRSMNDYCIGKACDEKDLERDWVAAIDFNWSSSQAILTKIGALEELERPEKRLRTDLKIALTDQQQNLLFVSDGCVILDIRAQKWYVLSGELLKKLAAVDAYIESMRCDMNHVPIISR